MKIANLPPRQGIGRYFSVAVAMKQGTATFFSEPKLVRTPVRPGVLLGARRLFSEAIRGAERGPRRASPEQYAVYREAAKLLGLPEKDLRKNRVVFLKLLLAVERLERPAFIRPDQRQSIRDLDRFFTRLTAEQDH